jgi:hypothetical protein
LAYTNLPFPLLSPLGYTRYFLPGCICLGGGKSDVGLNVYLPPPSVKGTCGVLGALFNTGGLAAVPKGRLCVLGGGGGNGDRGGVGTGE